MTVGAELPLVTGAGGFAGRHLVDRLLESHGRVHAWAHRTLPSDEASEQVRWERVDLLDRERVAAALRAARPSVIYHCAGVPNVAESWKEADRALQVNAIGTHHLLDGVRAEAPDAKVIVVGSALVYRPSGGALTEDSPLGPADPYGVSKLAQEMLALRASIPVVVARPFNHAGPRQQPTFATSSFARQIAAIEAGLTEPRILVGNLDSRRDLTDVRDTVRGYEALGSRGVPGRAYNICSGRAYRIGDLLDMLIARARVPIRVEQDASRMRPSDNPLVLGDASRAERETGWRPTITIEQTLDDLLAWWRVQVATHRS